MFAARGWSGLGRRSVRRFTLECTCKFSREAQVIVSLQAKHIKTGEERVIKAVKKSRTALPLDEIEQEILIMRPEIRRFSPCRFLKQCQAN